VDRNNFAFKCA